MDSIKSSNIFKSKYYNFSFPMQSNLLLAARNTSQVDNLCFNLGYALPVIEVEI